MIFICSGDVSGDIYFICILETNAHYYLFPYVFSHFGTLAEVVECLIIIFVLFFVLSSVF